MIGARGQRYEKAKARDCDENKCTRASLQVSAVRTSLRVAIARLGEGRKRCTRDQEQVSASGESKSESKIRGESTIPYGKERTKFTESVSVDARVFLIAVIVVIVRFSYLSRLCVFAHLGPFLSITTSKTLQSLTEN